MSEFFSVNGKKPIVPIDSSLQGAQTQKIETKKVPVISTPNEKKTIPGAELETNENAKTTTAEQLEAMGIARRNEIAETYQKKMSSQLEGAEKELLDKMTEAIKKGDEKTAAGFYEILENNGVFERDGAKPPYAKELKSVLEQTKREEVANKVVDDVNTRAGQENLLKSLRGMDEKSEVQAMGKAANLEKVHGSRKIAKANRKNAEHVERQLNLQKVFVEGKTYTIDGKKMTAEEAYEYNKDKLGDKWNKKQPQAQVMSKEGYKVAEKLNVAAMKIGAASILNPDGSVNIEKAQAAARRMVSITGDRGDRNEMDAVAKDLGVTTKDLKAFLRGLNVDYKKDRRWVAQAVGGAAGVAAGVVSLETDLLTGGAVNFVLAGATHTVVNNKEIITDNTIIDKNSGYGTNGEYFEHVKVDVTSVTTTEAGTPVTTKDPDTTVSKKPKKGAGDYINAALVGYSMYELTKTALNKVLNHDPQILRKGKTVADALDDPSALKQKSNQDVMTMIKNFKFDEKHNLDEATQKQIKLALLEEAMGSNLGGKLNRRELSGVRAALDAINNGKPINEPQPSTPTVTTPTVTTPTVTTPTVTTPQQQEPCEDIETRSSHGDIIPSKDVRGHGQSPYWVAKAYISSDGSELTPAQRREVQKLLAKEENKQVQENGNFNGSRIGYRYRREITLSDGTVVKLADNAAQRIGTGRTTNTRTVIKNGKQITEERTVDCDSRKPVDGPEGQWHPAK